MEGSKREKGVYKSDKASKLGAWGCPLHSIRKVGEWINLLASEWLIKMWKKA